MAKLSDTIELEIKMATADLIITTPKQLEDAFTLWNKRFIESPTEYDAEAYFSDPEGSAKQSSQYLIEILQELNENASATN